MPQLLATLLALLASLTTALNALPPQTQLAQVLPTAGLVAYWSFDDSLDDGLAADASGNNLTAACAVGSSCPQPVAGQVGGAYQFDGT
ncbi:MAG: hypothetical protein HYT48_02070, partial [Candidatus Vogelbacteria bacterium]|nr:hypothetical protein [Candidatus Vogelbacteria bacterium]